MDIAYSERLADLVLQARIGWGIASVSLVLLAILMVRLGKRFSNHISVQRKEHETGPHWLRMHRSESATASMEYLLVLVPFLIIVMTVWQLAFMLNARTHVGYATYAVARSAAVLIPAETDAEKEGILEPQSGNSKWARIRKAAIPGTLAISPGDATSAIGVATADAVSGFIGGSGGFSAPTTPNGAGMAARIVLMSAHMCSTPIFCTPQGLTGTRPLRAAVKHYYAENMTKVSIGAPGGTLQNHTTQQDLSGQDVVNIKVEYVYWLHVPYVGRLIAGSLFNLNPFPSIVLTEETSINTWLKKRATDPCT